jgi:hypothetical protein
LKRYTGVYERTVVNGREGDMKRLLIMIPLLLLVSSCGEDCTPIEPDVIYVTSEPGTLEGWRSLLDIVIGGDGTMQAYPKNMDSQPELRLIIHAARVDGVDSLVLTNLSHESAHHFTFIIEVGHEVSAITFSITFLSSGLLEKGQFDLTDSYKLFKPYLKRGLRAIISDDTTWELIDEWELTDEEITKMRAAIDFFEFWISQQETASDTPLEVVN